MEFIDLKNVEKKYKNGVTAIYDLNISCKTSFISGFSVS